jgi:hypothetical protein
MFRMFNSFHLKLPHESPPELMTESVETVYICCPVTYLLAKLCKLFNSCSIYWYTLKTETGWIMQAEWTAWSWICRLCILMRRILIVVLPCILISSKLFCQQMHSLLKHKMLQLTLKISLYMAPTCFGPFGQSSGSIRWNLAEVSLCRNY